MKRIRLFFLLLLPTSCLQASVSDNGLKLAEGWRSEQVAAWGHDRPDMLHLSADEQQLYLSFENGSAGKPALGRISLQGQMTGIRLLSGLKAGDGLRLDTQGNAWLGEEVEDGHVWLIRHPGQLPPNQTANRVSGRTSHGDILMMPQAGRISHEGLCFSADARFLYMLDEWRRGGLYRLTLKTQQLAVFHRQHGWLPIRQPEQARTEALSLHATTFQRGEDMELMPDGTVLFAETNTGLILQLDDRGALPKVRPFLHHAAIEHPDNLEWDNHRHWLWITDDSRLSELWAWDGKDFHRIAHTKSGEITGVETAADGRVWINLQGKSQGEDQTVLLKP